MEPKTRGVILLVEDSADVRESLAALLSLSGFEVIEAANGEMALKLLCEHPIDVVLTDVAMPEVSGLDLVALMKQDPFFQRVPVVAMTAYGHAQARKALDAGAVQCFEKPLRRSELIVTIERLLVASNVPVRLRASLVDPGSGRYRSAILPPAETPFAKSAPRRSR